MKYERLTVVLPNGECRIAETKFNGDEAKQKAIDRLAEREDKIEAGTLAEVGKLFIEYDEIGGGYLICKYGKQSKGVEFTREAAEKRLKELRGER